MRVLLKHGPVLRPVLRAVSRAGLVLSALCIGALGIGSSHALDLDAAALARLQAGEPVTAFVADAQESAAGVLEAVVDVPAPPQAVWKILTDCDLNVKVFNGLKACRVISRENDGATDVREHSISWSRLLPTVRSVFKSSYDTGTLIRFEKTEGDLKRLTGQWRLEPTPGGTRLHYKADIAVGIPVPAMLVKAALEGDMPKTMKAIRKAAMDGLGG
jgi:carbon monoxide dehydrogenase subunit G